VLAVQEGGRLCNLFGLPQQAAQRRRSRRLHSGSFFGIWRPFPGRTEVTPGPAPAPTRAGRPDARERPTSAAGDVVACQRLASQRSGKATLTSLNAARTLRERVAPRTKSADSWHHEGWPSAGPQGRPRRGTRQTLPGVEEPRGEAARRARLALCGRGWRRGVGRQRRRRARRCRSVTGEPPPMCFAASSAPPGTRRASFPTWLGRLATLAAPDMDSNAPFQSVARRLAARPRGMETPGTTAF